MNTLLVGIGGAVGSIARYHIGLASMKRWPGFPWGTLAVNLLGSFVLSLVMALVLKGRFDDTTRIVLGVGVLGGFTTYSSFNYETIALVHAGSYGRAVAYVVATLLGCLVVGVAGWLTARAFS
ncbi:MAG: fluoride efflux transporter CrcB [Deltaproteobacteria bacterium]|nr:fluoride efflux transporter CrcB [Deltaproteobacteria bacterium]MDQ3297219.1 fluoride efflux transporter CrcB [Myxococcota bacterium]